MGTIQATIMFIAVLPQGFIVWNIAIASLAGCYIGGHIGTKIAIKKGNALVSIALAATMFISGAVILLVRT